MTDAEIVQHILDTFEGVNHLTNLGDHFFIYDPQLNLPPNKQMPFATLVTADNWDQASNLARRGVYRLNIGVSKHTYHHLFGPTPLGPTDGSVAQTGHDYTKLDELMPHPIYCRQFWVCVLNPTEHTWEKVKPLLAEAYEVAVRRTT